MSAPFGTTYREFSSRLSRISDAQALERFDADLERAWRDGVLDADEHSELATRLFRRVMAPRGGSTKGDL